MSKKKGEKRYGPPIYTIMMMEKSGADTYIYESGKDSGFPDVGCTDYAGFFYYYEDAVEAMHENLYDLRESAYNYGFILEHRPGLYQNSADNTCRTYFVWDADRGGFFEKDEPALLSVLAF